MACCPVHGAAGGDRRPSLRIRERNSRVYLDCFAGCDGKAVVEALGLSFHDLGYKSDPDWRKRIQTKAVHSAGKREPLGKQEAIYRYTDEHGELIAEKLRFEGKIFLWRRPQAGGGWLWKVDRSTLPLYMLHEIVPAKACVLTEGEKDVETLRSLGMAATTAPNGAESWRLDYAHWFANKKVWILPDSDPPGLRYAHQAAKQILTFARRVRIVYLPEGKDVTDFLRAHSKDELGKLMRQV
jgi:hypothetical protein